MGPCWGESIDVCVWFSYFVLLSLPPTQQAWKYTNIQVFGSPVFVLLVLQNNSFHLLNKNQRQQQWNWLFFGFFFVLYLFFLFYQCRNVSTKRLVPFNGPRCLGPFAVSGHNTTSSTVYLTCLASKYALPACPSECICTGFISTHTRPLSINAESSWEPFHRVVPGLLHVRSMLSVFNRCAYIAFFRACVSAHLTGSLMRCHFYRSSGSDKAYSKRDILRATATCNG